MLKLRCPQQLLSCSTSKILSKVRYTRVDIEVCRKLFSTGLFCAPLLMSPDVPLQPSYLGEVLFAHILTHVQGLVCVSVVQSFTVSVRSPWKEVLLILAVYHPRLTSIVQNQIRDQTTEDYVVLICKIPYCRSQVAYPVLYVFLLFLISKYSTTQSRGLFQLHPKTDWNEI